MNRRRLLCLSLTIVTALPSVATAQVGPAPATQPQGPSQLSADKDVAQAKVLELEQKATEVAKLATQVEKRATEVEKEKTAVANEKATVAQSTLDELRSAKLMKLGVTGGVAAMFIAPVSQSKFMSSSLVVAAMPHVTFYPAYWVGKSSAQNEYCASTFIGTDSAQARAAANRVAQSTSRDKLASLIAKIAMADGKNSRLGFGKKEDGPERFCAKEDTEVGKSRRALCNYIEGIDDDAEYGSRTAQSAFAAVQIYRDGLAASPPADLEIRKDYWVIDDASETAVPYKNYKCAWRRVGLYLGIPLPVAVEVSESRAAPSQTRDLNGVISFGLTIAPNSYIQLMAGYSNGRVKVPVSGGAEVSDTNHSFAFGLGGNLDVFTAITTK